MGKLKSIHINLIFTVILVQAIFFIGLILSFLTFKLLPGDIVPRALSAAGIYDPSQELIDAMKHQLGLDLPFFAQFLNYVGRLFSGNWGRSISIVRNMLVYTLIKSKLPATIVVIFVPVIIGILFGILLGMVSSRYRNKWQDIVIQIFCYFILAIPVFFSGWYFVFYFGYSFGMIIFATRFILTLAIIAIITLQTRSYLTKKQNNRSIIPFTLIVAKLFGIIFAFYLLLDTTFGVNSFGKLLIDALLLNDYYVILAALYILVMVLVFTIIISNMHFILYQYLASDRFREMFSKFYTPKTKILESNPRNEEKLKDYLVLRLKSPIFIIGIISVLTLVILAIFPRIITQYSLDYVLQPHSGSWNPPTPDHPLGQTAMGGDVLGRTMYGIGDSLVFGLATVIIGMIGGVNFGFVAGRFKCWGYKLIMAFMMLFYLFPSILFVILLLMIFDLSYFIAMISIGFMLIPLFTYVTANVMSEEINKELIYKIARSLISFIPLGIAVSILLYNSVAYLGFIQEIRTILGGDINVARENPYDAPWAYFWPGLILSIMVFSFFMFHLGLKGLGSISRIKELNEDLK
ncbi:MAG: hypothetical protein ACFFA3_11805 [Promethearchaeota archaeon]